MTPQHEPPPQDPNQRRHPRYQPPYPVQPAQPPPGPPPGPYVQPTQPQYPQQNPYPPPDPYAQQPYLQDPYAQDPYLQEPAYGQSADDAATQAVAYSPSPPQEPQPQARGSRDLHNLPAMFILLLAGGGVLYAGLVPNHWLRGVLFMAGALGLAGLFRLVLPARQAGWLAVRGRIVDVISYVGAGSALWVVGLLLPPGRT